jgi:hypothetical protein
VTQHPESPIGRKDKVGGALRRHPNLYGLAVYGILLLLLIAPTLRMYYWGGHEEYYPVMRVMHLAALWESEGPLHRPWFPEVCHGYGWPFFTYYAPLGYYVGAGVHLVSGWSAGASTRAAFYLSLALGGVLMYGLALRLAREGDSRKGAAWATAIATAYTVTPFHVADVFARGSLAQSWAWAVLPGVFLAVEWIRRRPAAGMLALAVSGAALVLSHNVIALYAILFIAIYAAVMVRGWRAWVALCGGGILALLLSVYYWYPALRLLFLVRAGDVGAMWGDAGSLWDHAVYWRQHLVETHGRGASGWGPNDALGINLGLVMLGGALLALVSLFRDGLGSGARLRIIVSLGMVLWLLFAMSPQMPWDWVPGVFRYVQFPWRFLLFTSVFCCLALASAAPVAGRWVHPVAMLIVAALLGIPPVSRSVLPARRAPMNDDAVCRWYSEAEARRVFAGCVARDYKPLTAADKFLDPVYVKENPPPADRLEVVSGDLRVRNFEHKGTSYRYEYTATVESTVRIHVFDFPGWELRLDGSKEPARLEWDAEGLVRFALPPGERTAVLRYGLSSAGRFALRITYTAWVLWGIIGVALIWKTWRRPGAYDRKDVHCRKPATHSPDIPDTQ